MLDEQYQLHGFEVFLKYSYHIRLSDRFSIFQRNRLISSKKLRTVWTCGRKTNALNFTTILVLESMLQIYDRRCTLSLQIIGKPKRYMARTAKADKVRVSLSILFNLVFSTQ